MHTIQHDIEMNHGQSDHSGAFRRMKRKLAFELGCRFHGRESSISPAVPGIVTIIMPSSIKSAHAPFNLYTYFVCTHVAATTPPHAICGLYTATFDFPSTAQNSARSVYAKNFPFSHPSISRPCEERVFLDGCRDLWSSYKA